MARSQRRRDSQVARRSRAQLARFDPPTTYCFEGGWHLALESHDERTRLIARGRFPRGAFTLAYTVLLELPHFIMERKMLLGVKERAEQARFADNPSGESDRA